MVMLAVLLAAAAPLAVGAPPAAPRETAAALPQGAGSSRAAITTRDLVEVAEITGVSISPDGRFTAYRVSRPSVDSNSITLDWYVVPLTGGPPTRIGSGGTAQHGGAGSLTEQLPVWDRDSKGLRFRAFVDGAVGIWHWRQGGQASPEVVDAADIATFDLSQDGRTLRYTAGATRAEIAAAERSAYNEGVLVDHTLDLMQPVAGGTLEGGQRIMQRLPSAWFDRQRILSQAPKKETIVALGENRGAEGSASATPVFAAPQATKVQGANGSTAEMVSEGGAHRVVVTRSDGTTIRCAAAICSAAQLAALAWRPGHDALILFERVGSAREQIWSWRVGDRRAHLITFTDGEQRSLLHPPRCALGSDALVCAQSMATIPPHLVRIDYASGRASVLADPNAALRPRIAATATPMRWDRDVTGILLRPAQATGPLPLVVQYYRCAGFLKGGVGDEIPMLPLVEHGIAVLCMDRIRAPKDAGMDASYALALSDIGGAIDQLVQAGLVDPARVGIGGLSFGSEVALWSIRKSRRFAAATLSSGQMSPIYFWSNALPGRGFAATLEEYWKVGDPDRDPERWKQLSGVNDLTVIDTPLLLQLPESEARYAIELHTRLKLAGKPVEMFAFADEPHIKKQPAHKRAIYERNLDWYRFWLKGEEDPDPAKMAQYARWRGLRAARGTAPST